jgi:hypothetical protein
MAKPAPEPQPATRAEFFDWEKKAWSQLVAVWRSLPDQALLQAGACGPEWSVKDVMNHIAAWQEAALRAVGDLLAGRWARLGSDTDRFNAQQYTLDRDRPLADTRQRLSRSRRELLALLATVPEDSLLNPFGRQQIGWWAKYATYGHYREHIPDLIEFRNRPNSPNPQVKAQPLAKWKARHTNL